MPVSTEPSRSAVEQTNVHVAGGKFPLALVGATVYATAKDHVTIEGVMTIKKANSVDMNPLVCFAPEQSLD